VTSAVATDRAQRSLGPVLHDRLADVTSPSSLSTRFRQRRWHLLLQCFPELEEMTVIDLGGEAAAWRHAPTRPACVVLVNADDQPPPVEPWMRTVTADACELPDQLLAGSWDLAYSNSVIEHVGGHARRVRFAAAIGALAPRHWVQTPNRHFPIEPHFLFPGLQYLPTRLRAQVILRWPLNRWPPADATEATRTALELELLDTTAMRHYFPGSQLLRERTAGLTKSLIAVGRPSSPTASTRS
jgi:hypothetical protein